MAHAHTEMHPWLHLRAINRTPSNKHFPYGDIHNPTVVMIHPFRNGHFDIDF